MPSSSAGSEGNPFAAFVGAVGAATPQVTAEPAATDEAAIQPAFVVFVALILVVAGVMGLRRRATRRAR